MRPRFAVCSFTNRSLRHWLPFFESLARDVGEVVLCSFPRSTDPDRIDACVFPFEVAYSRAIDRQLRPIDISLSHFWDEFASAVRRAKPTHVFCCTAHAGPERYLRGNLWRRGLFPKVIGLQHGFHQWWEGYNLHWDFDYFGTFGDRYLRYFNDENKDKLLPLGLPALDLVPECSSAAPGAPILFAAQSEPDILQMATFLTELGDRRNQEILVRPHPELLHAFEPLRGKFQFAEEGTLDAWLHRISMMISTGSTAVLHALAANKITLVLPVQSGPLYSELGIVLDDISTDSAEKVIAAQEAGNFGIRRAEFLISATGSDKSTRTNRALNIFCEKLI